MSNPECPRNLSDKPYSFDPLWPEDGTCHYCGSLLPETFVACLEAGTIKLTPTDKVYKVYVHT